MHARVITGLILFCGLPAAAGTAVQGWLGLLWAFAIPAVFVLAGFVFMLGVTIEWVTGTRPQDYRDRQRELDNER